MQVSVSLVVSAVGVLVVTLMVTAAGMKVGAMKAEQRAAVAFSKAQN